MTLVPGVENSFKRLRQCPWCQAPCPRIWSCVQLHSEDSRSHGEINCHIISISCDAYGVSVPLGGEGKDSSFGQNTWWRNGTRLSSAACMTTLLEDFALQISRQRPEQILEIIIMIIITLFCFFFCFTGLPFNKSLFRLRLLQLQIPPFCFVRMHFPTVFFEYNMPSVNQTFSHN